MNDFQLLMISAMYENGGNTTHRLLDGHPELFVYPFESQPGTKYVNDYLTSMFPVKYRWPVFPGHFTAAQAFHAIIDEECKVRARTPYVSKFRDADFQLDDEERKQYFIQWLENKPLTRAQLVEAFYRSTFETWKNLNKTGREKCYVGYSPIIGVDGDKIIEDFQGKAYVLHVVRNPFSCFAETLKRPVPLSLDHYITAWILCQQLALFYSQKYSGHFYILRYEDIIENPQKVLGEVLMKIGISDSPTLQYPSWNGEPIKEVYPWGTIRIPTRETNLDTARKLSEEQISEIKTRTGYLLDIFTYNDFLSNLQ